MGIEVSQRIFKHSIESDKSQFTRYQVNNPDGSTIGITCQVNKLEEERFYYTVRWQNLIQYPGDFFQKAASVSSQASIEKGGTQTPEFYYYPKPVDGCALLTKVNPQIVIPRFRLNADELDYVRMDGNKCYFYYDFDLNPNHRQTNLHFSSTQYAPEVFADFVEETSRNRIDRGSLVRVLDYVGRGQID